VPRSFFRDSIVAEGPYGVVLLDNAAVRFYEDNDGGPLTPITFPLYADQTATTPLPVPYITGGTGELEVWADEPHRVKIVAQKAGLVEVTEVIDLEWPPEVIASSEDVTEAIAAHEAAADPHPVYLTQPEGDGRYLQLSTWTQPDPLPQYQQESEKGQPSGYAPLDPNRLIPTVHLPPLAITDTFVVASQAEMLALPAQTGDVAIRTDTGKSYILAAEPATALINWKELSAAAPVQSVNGYVGVVNLVANDVGAYAKTAADSKFVDVTGDTMTGQLNGTAFAASGSGFATTGPGGGVILYDWSASGNNYSIFPYAEQWTVWSSGGASPILSLDRIGPKLTVPGNVTMNSATVASKPLVVSPSAGNILTWDATGLLATLTTANVTVLNRQEFSPGAGATTVTLSSTPNSVLQVARNGVEQSAALGHYSLAGATITFTDAFAAGEQVIVLSERGTSVPTNTYDQATSDARFVNVSGDTMTGDLARSGADLTDRLIKWQTNGADRWRLGVKDAQAEGTPDVGADFVLDAVWNNGVTQNVLVIDRDQGKVTVNTEFQPLTLTGAGVYIWTPGDTNPKMMLTANAIQWGLGSANTDASLVRNGANDLRTQSSFTPTTTNTRDLGTSANRWRKLWTTDVDINTGLTFAGDATAKLSRPSTGALRVDTNLGVGVNPDAWAAGYTGLQLGSTGALMANSPAGAGGFYLLNNSYYDGNFKARYTGTGVYLALFGDGTFGVAKAASVAAGAIQSFAQRLNINASGTLTLYPDAGAYPLVINPNDSGRGHRVFWQRNGANLWANMVGPSDEWELWEKTLGALRFSINQGGAVSMTGGLTFTGGGNTQIDSPSGYDLRAGGSAMLTIYRAAGSVYPQPDNSVASGLSSNRYTAVYATNGAIQTSDPSQKLGMVPVDPEDALKQVLDTRVIAYEMACPTGDDPDQTMLHVGFSEAPPRLFVGRRARGRSAEPGEVVTSAEVEANTTASLALAAIQALAAQVAALRAQLGVA